MCGYMQWLIAQTDINAYYVLTLAIIQSVMGGSAPNEVCREAVVGDNSKDDSLRASSLVFHTYTMHLYTTLNSYIIVTYMHTLYIIII